MNCSQAFRVLKTWSKRHVFKLWSANCNTIEPPIGHASSNKSFRTAWCVTNKCNFASDSRDPSLDAERNKMRDDPEIRTWMKKIAQDFENVRSTAPFEDLVDKSQILHAESRSLDKSASYQSETPVQDTLDIEVEDFGYLEDDEEEFEEAVAERKVPISLERGKHGVFDVEEIVAVLEDENGVDIQVIDIPPEKIFVDHMVVVSGRSLRHMQAMTASIEWLYKRKKGKGDEQFMLEGRDCTDWFAMDLGNIAVHIFMPETRRHYDIESLWTLGPEHEDQRHYVHDDSLNLSAADLFWLEKGGSNEPCDASSTHTLEEMNDVETDGSEDNLFHSTDQCLKTSVDSVDDYSVSFPKHGKSEGDEKSDN